MALDFLCSIKQPKQLACAVIKSSCSNQTADALHIGRLIALQALTLICISDWVHITQLCSGCNAVLSASIGNICWLANSKTCLLLTLHALAV